MKKRLLVVILVFTLLISVSVAPSTVATDTEGVSKMSDELAEILDSAEANEKIKIVLWLEDIDYSTTVDKKVKEITGYDKDDIQKIRDTVIANRTLSSSKNVLENIEKNKIEGAVETEEWITENETIRKSIEIKVDNYIVNERKISAEEYTKKNKKILSELDFKEDDIAFVSRYTPLVIVETSINNVKNIADKNNVKEIDICDELGNSENLYELTDEDLSQPSNIPIHATAVGIEGSYSNLFYNTYNGSGIKIGQIEGGVPDPNDNYLSNSDITVISTNANVSNHATAVARVLVGLDGLTKNAELYCSKYNFQQYETFYTGVENLISYNVNVINMSSRVDYRPSNVYTATEKWIDHISNIHGVSFVSAAGNEGDSNGKVANPAMAYNSITVGAIDDMASTDKTDDVFAYYSSYLNFGDNGCAKPDVVAPGSKFFNVGGTSFAAPMVTSVVASMMNILPALKTNPSAVKAILLASCDRKVPGESLGGITQKQGAGVINYGDLVWIIMNARYLTATTSTTQQRIYISSEIYKARIALAWLRKNYVTSTDHTILENIEEVPYTNLDMFVYTDVENYEMGRSELLRSSTELVHSYMRSTNGFFKVSITKPTNSYATTYSLAWY